MTIKSMVWAGALAAIASVGAVSSAQAQDYRYRDYSKYQYKIGRQSGRRATLRDRLFRISRQLNSEVRRGTIDRRTAHRESERLDRVSDFLKNDEHIKSSEYDDRNADLDRVERDLRDHRWHDDSYRGDRRGDHRDDRR